MGDTFREMLRGGFHPSETTVAEKTLQSFAGRLKDVSQQSFTQPLPLRGSCEKSEGTGS